MHSFVEGFKKFIYLHTILVILFLHQALGHLRCHEERIKHFENSLNF